MTKTWHCCGAGAGCRRYNKYELPVMSIMLASHCWRLEVALERAGAGTGAGADADACAHAKGGRPPSPRPLSSLSSVVYARSVRKILFLDNHSGVCS